ncbi:MAG: Gldg family protein [Clostridia bacterium]|nr:Gldg family protein [Clostridia bacterium]
MNHSPLFRMKRSVKIGTFVFVAGVILLALLIVANFLVSALPAKLTRFDASGRGLTEISDETQRMVSGMTEDVTIYWLCENGAVDTQTRLLLSRYEEAGEHIRVEIVDPTKDTEVSRRYDLSTMSAYSFIVESARRFTVVDNLDTYLYTNYAFEEAYKYYPNYLPADIVKPMSATVLQSALSQYGPTVLTILSMVYGKDMTGEDISQFNAVTAYCGEARLTSALDYVTREYIPHPYLLTGFGDSMPSDSLITLLYSLGMDLGTLDLSKSEIPVDANCLVLFNPSRDLTVQEVAAIAEYLNGGGTLMLNTSPELVESCPNLASVTAMFGLTPAPGLVQEGDQSYVSGSQYTLMPTVTTKHSSASYLSSNGYKPQMPNSHAITVAATLPADVTAIPLFTTSDKATRVSLDKSQALNTAGILDVAVAASKNITTEDGTVKTAAITWYASADALTDDTAEDTSGVNYYYYAATMSVMGEIFTSPYEELSTVALQSGYLEADQTAQIICLVGGVILVPVALLTTGIVIWIRRKRR